MRSAKCKRKLHICFNCPVGLSGSISWSAYGTKAHRLLFLRGKSEKGCDMRKILFYSIAATLVAAPLATVVKAEDTTIIKRDGDGDKKVIEKRERMDVLPVPHTEEKTIIKKERD
jgi:hypothetical protein